MHVEKLQGKVGGGGCVGKETLEKGQGDRRNSLGGAIFRGERVRSAYSVRAKKKGGGGEGGRRDWSKIGERGTAIKKKSNH